MKPIGRDEKLRSERFSENTGLRNAAVSPRKDVPMAKFTDQFPNPGPPPPCAPPLRDLRTKSAEEMEAWARTGADYLRYLHASRCHLVAVALDQLHDQMRARGGATPATPAETIILVLGIDFLDRFQAEDIARDGE